MNHLLFVVSVFFLLGCSTESTDQQKTTKKIKLQEVSQDNQSSEQTNNSQQAGTDTSTMEASTNEAGQGANASGETNQGGMNPENPSADGDNKMTDIPKVSELEIDKFDALSNLLNDYSVCLGHQEFYEGTFEPVEDGVKALVCKKKVQHTGCGKRLGYATLQECQNPFGDLLGGGGIYTCQAEITEYRLTANGCKLIQFTGCGVSKIGFRSMGECQTEYDKRVACDAFSGFEIIDGICTERKEIRTCEDRYSFKSESSCQQFLEAVKVL